MLETISINDQSAFQLRGSLFTMSVMQLIEFDLDRISKELHILTKKAPKFFQCAPIVIDLQYLAANSPKIDFNALTNTLREKGMIPVGVRGGTKEQHQIAKSHGLALLSIAKSAEPSLASGNKGTEKVEKVKTPQKHEATLTINRPVRSGQQVYARNADLIVIGAVSQGAELLADGNIHIYGPLRGRALAGINNDIHARIFCQSMEAELVSIAGQYIVNETLIKPMINTPQQIFIDNGKLTIAKL